VSVVWGAWNVGRFDGWKVGMLEGWNVGMLECWNVGRLEGLMVGRLECWKVGMLECWNVGSKAADFFLYKIINVKLILDQATKAQRRSRVTALLLL